MDLNLALVIVAIVALVAMSHNKDKIADRAMDTLDKLTTVINKRKKP